MATPTYTSTTPPPAAGGGAPNTPVAPGFDARFIAELGAKADGVDLVHVDLTGLGDYAIGLPENIPLVWDGKASRLIALKAEIEAYRFKPSHKAGTAQVLTLSSFIALTNRHKTDASVVFADTDWTQPSFTAVIDYHPKELEPLLGAIQADNGKHRIHYAFPLSDEWKAWIEQDGKAMSQLDFAVFLEDRMPELAAPTEAEAIALERDFSTTIATPSRLVQLSRGLKVNVSSQVEDERTLQTGEGQIKWQETHKDGDGQPLKVPGIFLLSISPFKAGGTVRIPARLRYRVSGGEVVWFYQLYRPDLHITDRVEIDLGLVAKETGLPTYEGRPEMTA